MISTEQTCNQINHAISKIVQHYAKGEELPADITDIHVFVSQDTGELKAYNDDEIEITRCVIEQWIDNNDEDFYAEVTDILRKCLNCQSKLIDNMRIMKPFSFVLENEDFEHIAELYVADDDTVIISDDLMKNLDSDLDTFLQQLLKN